MEVTEKQWELIDDLLSEFPMNCAEPVEGWFCIGPETQQALQSMYDYSQEQELSGEGRR